jgi:hypothetical protein
MASCKTVAVHQNELGRDGIRRARPDNNEILAICNHTVFFTPLTPLSKTFLFPQISRNGCLSTERFLHSSASLNHQLGRLQETSYSAALPFLYPTSLVYRTK